MEEEKFPRTVELTRSVLVLTSSFPRFRGDYVGAFVQDSSQALLKIGFEISVLTPADKTPTSYHPTGVPVMRFNYFIPKSSQRVAFGGGLAHNLTNSLMAILQLPAFLFSFLFRTLTLSRKKDILLANWLFPSGLVGVLCRKLVGIPLIITVRGSDVNLIKGSFLQILMRSIASSTDAIICVSNPLKQKLLSWGIPPDKVWSFPEGVPNFDKQTDRETELVLFVGRLAVEKGVDDLLQAVSVLSRDHCFRLLIAGDGPLHDEMIGIASTISEQIQVKFLGRISREDVPRLVSRSSLLVLPSISEGLPDTLLIAMSCGTPVLSTRIPGVEQVVENGRTGILVSPSSPEELTDALRKILQSPVQMRRMGLRGSRSVGKRYPRSEMIGKLANILISLTDSSSRRS